MVSQIVFKQYSYVLYFKLNYKEKVRNWEIHKAWQCFQQ